MARPGTLLRINGALGPLQEMAVTGVLTIKLEPDSGTTRATVTYRVSGDTSHQLDKLAPIVNDVLNLQFGSLAKFAATVPSPAPRFVTSGEDRPTRASLSRAAGAAALPDRARWRPRPGSCESASFYCRCRRAPSCRNTTACPWPSDASPDRARPEEFLVEDGAEMIVASTIVPVLTFKPFSFRYRFTAAKICFPSSCFSRQMTELAHRRLVRRRLPTPDQCRRNFSSPPSHTALPPPPDRRG